MRNRVFIVNPHAARGTVGKNWPQIRELAEKHLGGFKSFITTATGEATQFARLAVSEGVLRQKVAVQETYAITGWKMSLNSFPSRFRGRKLCKQRSIEST